MRRLIALGAALGCASAPIVPPTLRVSDPPPHPAEARGFLQVPRDWGHPGDGELRVFYRLVGSDPAKPVLVFFNGGPGLPSSAYVSLDRAKNSLAEYERSFRLLLIDQRGTGLSTPVDVDSPRFDPRTVVALFGAWQQARDAAAIIDQVVPPRDA